MQHQLSLQDELCLSVLASKSAIVKGSPADVIMKGSPLCRLKCASGEKVGGEGPTGPQELARSSSFTVRGATGYSKNAMPH